MDSLSIVKTHSMRTDFFTEKRKTLAPGEKIDLGPNTINNAKKLSFSCAFSDFGLVRVGHGKTEYNSHYVEITKDKLTVWTYATGASVVKEAEHGLDIRNYITVIIDVGFGYADITLFTTAGMFQLKNVGWLGRNGNVYAECENCELSDVKMNWACDGFSYGLYAIGDSYFNPLSPARWPSYLGVNGYKKNLLFGYAGMGADPGIRDFRMAIKHGIPQYAVWCIGMNNQDVDGKINASWLAAVEEFLKLCDENGIVPILSTIPNVPCRDNSPKNNYVIASGRRYIDFATAVGALEGNVWYDGMLYEPDKVHPTELGAKALYMRAMMDCPEFMLGQG